MNYLIERIAGPAINATSLTPPDAGTDRVSRIYLSAVIRGEPDEAARERISRLFHSPLGVYVSHASRDHGNLRLVFDIAVEDLDFTVRTLHRVLPEAMIEAIRPRVFNHRREH